MRALLEYLLWELESQSVQLCVKNASKRKEQKKERVGEWERNYPLTFKLFRFTNHRSWAMVNSTLCSRMKYAR